MKHIYHVCLGARKNNLGFGSLWVDVEMDIEGATLTDGGELKTFNYELNRKAIAIGESLCQTMKGYFTVEETHYDRAVPSTAEEYLGPEYKEKVAKVQAAFKEVIRVAEAEGLRIAVSRNTSPASGYKICAVPAQPVPDHFRIDLSSLRAKVIPLLDEGCPIPGLCDLYYNGN